MRMFVIVAEDDVDARFLISRTLIRLDPEAHVEAVGSGQAIAALVERFGPRVTHVIADHNMREPKTGLDRLTEISPLVPGARLILHTGVPIGPAERQRAEAGGVTIVVKSAGFEPLRRELVERG